MRKLKKNSLSLFKHNRNILSKEITLNLIGALTSKQYAFKARSWELQKSENIDFSDAFCVNIVIYTKLISNKEILRIYT